VEDQGAVDQVLAGDTSAFASIVRRWQGPIVNLAYRFCRDRSRAEDLAQEVFLRAFRALPKWRREAAFSTWLFALATNYFCSEIRRLPPRNEYVETLDSMSLDDVAAGEETASLVRRIVQSLPAKYREAVILFYFHDMDISQAARSLNIREGTLKARLSRARDVLRMKLGVSHGTRRA
jgi:RNA polymerase sigma-70 factor (ECF subfamily)